MDDRIPSIGRDAPPFAIPPYPGQRYELWVPDTLDVQERAGLAVNALTSLTDPDRDHIIYFGVSFLTNPPSMTHDASDICQTKFEESLPLMRLASGSSLNDHVDRVWMTAALRQIGPDGLFYWPYFPWARYPDWGRQYFRKTGPAPEEGRYAVPLFCGRRIGAMTVYRLRDGSGPWDAAIRGMVGGLRAAAIERDDYAFFPQGELLPGEPRVRDAALPVGIWSSLVGWVVQGLAQYHRASGHGPAADLAGKLARYLVFHGRYYGPDGEFLPNFAGADGGAVADREGFQGFDPGGPGPWRENVHFQHHTVPLLGLLDHALGVGDRAIADFVRRSFEWARSRGCADVGYFPENLGVPHRAQPAETCSVAGMIALALKLSAAGLGDYWDDADRWIRNQFAESQLLRPDGAYRMSALTGVHRPTVHDPRTTTVDRVPERSVGGFAGWPTANDWGSGMALCCTGNATRCLYYVWEHIIDHRNGMLSVNLPLNRPSSWADVNSHLPYRGQVDVLVKKPCRLRVRIPSWVTPGEVRCAIGSGDRRLAWDGRYAVVGDVAPRDTVSLTFPIGERAAEADIEKQNYALTWRGHEVVCIDPPGRFYPFYQRGHLRQQSTRWRKMQRFVSDETLAW